MNFIKSLQAENETLKAQKDAMFQEIAAIRATLASPKFVGIESNGSRKDWVATSDVYAWLNGIREAANEIF